MFSRIIAVILSIFSVFTAPFSQLFSEIELKSELSKGNYESPYVVRPLEEITVNGTSLDEYCVISPDGELYSNAAKTLCNELYKTCGKSIKTAKASDEKAFVIDETLNNSNIFSLKVQNGNVYIKGSSEVGISRGIAAFADEVLLNSNNSYDFKDGYEFTKAFTDYVTYEDFGAVGDGKADDFEAIVKTHEYANANSFKVFANETAT